MSIERTSSGSARTVLRFLPRLGLLLAVTLAGLGLLAWRAWAGDTSFPPWLSAILRPWRKGKRLRPGGLLGSFLKRSYSPARRPELYRRRDPADLSCSEVMEIYALRI